MKRLALVVIALLIAVASFGTDYAYNPHGYVWYYAGNPHNIEVECTNFSSNSAKTKFRVKKHDGNNFGSNVIVYIHIDSPSGEVVKNVNVYSGSSYGTSGYYYFDNDVVDHSGREYYATLTVGGFTHIAGPINIHVENENVLDTPILQDPYDGQNNLSNPINFDWNNVSGATVYRIQISTNPNGWTTDNGFISTVVNTTTTSSSYTWGGAEVGETYYWSVRAGSETIYNSAYASYKSFKIRLDNVEITSPNNGESVEIPFTISWNPVEEATSYRVSITHDSYGFNNDPSGSTPFDSEVFNDVTSQTFITIGSEYVSDGNSYRVSVRAGSDHVYHSLFCDPVEFNAVTTPDVIISGIVKDEDDTPIGGVMISYSDGDFDVTSSTGMYSRTFSHGTDVRVTPSKDGYSFNPLYRDYENLSENQTNQDFTGSLDTYNISGYVTDDSDNGISGVTITFSNGGGTATTNSSGYYSKTLSHGYSGEATPTKEGYTFSPTYMLYENIDSDYTDQNFTGSINTCIISGYVRDGSSIGMPNVRVVFSNGGGSVVTDSNGFYEQVIEYGYEGTATPEKEGYVFNPVYIHYINLDEDALNDNYLCYQDPPLFKLPFPAGTTMYITNGYGDDVHHDNDYYCIDFNLSGSADFGIPVLASRDGIVTFAGWAGSYGYRVVIDHGDGWTSSYSHGTYITVSVGEEVVQGQEIMMLWNSSTNVFGAHLHYELEYNGVSVSIVNHSGYIQFDPPLADGYTSDNTYYVPGEMVEEPETPDFGSYSGSEIKGHNHMYKWATTVGDTATMSVKYRPYFEGETTVEILICVPGNHATTTDAVYHIHHLNGVEDFHVNQYAVNQPHFRWISLGEYTFGAGSNYYVELNNKVSDYNHETPPKIGFDAIYFRNLGEGGGSYHVAHVKIDSIGFSQDIEENMLIGFDSHIVNFGSDDVHIEEQYMAFTEVGNWNNVMVSNHVVQDVFLETGETINLTNHISTPSAGHYDFVYSFTLDSGEEIQWVEPVEVVTQTSSNDCDAVPTKYILYQNYPNPFNPKTTISYELSKDSYVEVEVFNIAGQVVKTLVKGHQSTGLHNVKFDATGLSSGIYFYRLKTNDFNQIRKLVLMK